MVMIPDRIVDEIRSRADLVEIVAEHTRLKRSGKTFRGPCPLHGGEGPNFSVDPGRNVFKCFVCGEGGDLFAFPMKHLGMSFTEAVRWIGARVGVEVPQDEPTPRVADPADPLREANAFAAEWFRQQLLDPEEGREAREYLARRGITTEVCERFGIGWAPAGWSGLSEAARARGIRREVLLELGLLKESKTAREPYDAFRGRVIFPIHDLGGTVVAFGGRVITPVEEHVPKYLNSPESPIYHKGDLLFGLRWSRAPIRREQVALVVEGYVDYVSLASHGVENVVAPLGTAMTQAQAELLARYAPRVVLLYDSDSAGLKATFRSADELLKAGVEVLVVTLPEGEDPDSVVQRGGKERLDQYVHDAIDVMERKIQILERKGAFSSIAGKRRAVDKLLPTVRATADEVLRELYVSRIADRTGLPRETLEKEVAEGEIAARRQAGRAGDAPRPARESAPRPEPAPAERRVSATRMGAERNVILLLLRDDQWLERVAARLGASDFRDPIYREIFEEMLQLHAEGAQIEGSAWLTTLDEPVSTRIQELLNDPEGWNLAHPDRFFEENVRQMELRNQEERFARIDQELRNASPEDQVRLLQEQRDLRVSLERAGLHMRKAPRDTSLDRRSFESS